MVNDCALRSSTPAPIAIAIAATAATPLRTVIRPFPAQFPNRRAPGSGNCNWKNDCSMNAANFGEGAVAMALRGRFAYVKAHDPAPSSGRPRRPCFPHRRLVLRLPGLLPVDPAGPEIQLPLGPLAHRRSEALRDQGAAVHPRRGGGVQADPSRDHL